MSNVTVEQVFNILSTWDGTPEDKMRQWTETYNFAIWPPPPPPFSTDAELAEYIAEVYTGDPLEDGK